jgi:DNA-binding beta-propeller fold protein YncE
VLSPDGTRLYTLYTVESLGTAFVHVLSLDEQWAHCVDLPPPFGETPAATAAVAVSPEGDRLFVADAGAGAVAEVDTRELAVARTADLPMDRGSDAAAAAVGDGKLYVGSGSEITTVDTGSLEAVGSWPIDGTLSTVRLGPGGDRLYVAIRDHVTVLETASGGQLRRFGAQGVRSISVLEGEAAPPPPVAPPSDYQCAC